MTERFILREAGRLIRFGPGVAAEAEELLEREGFSGYALLTTERALAAQPGLGGAAAEVIHVPPGKVDEISASLLGRAGARPLVALGGGRVIDAAKAIAGAGEGRCAAVPTTLSGAELTPFHRLPRGVDGARMVRPALVVADPELMASQPPAALAASAMNAMAHAMEALYTPLSNPVANLTALRGADLLAQGVGADPPARPKVALGALLAAYASALTGIAVHHALCQSLVRTAGSPHAETNAVVLPHSARMMGPRAPAALGRLAAALGDPAGRPEGAAERLAELSARSGHTGLLSLGVREEHLAPAARLATEHPSHASTPDPPGEQDLVALLRAAL